MSDLSEARIRRVRAGLLQLRDDFEKRSGTQRGFETSLAKRIGVKQPTVSKWLKGGGFSWESVELLAPLLGKTPQELAGPKDDPDEAEKTAIERAFRAVRVLCEDYPPAIVDEAIEAARRSGAKPDVNAIAEDVARRARAAGSESFLRAVPAPRNKSGHK